MSLKSTIHGVTVLSRCLLAKKRIYHTQPWNGNNPEHSGTHYTAIRGALLRDMFILMAIDWTHPKYRNTISYGEQAMFCHLETWRASILESVHDISEIPLMTNILRVVSIFDIPKTDSAMVHSISVQVAKQNQSSGGVLHKTLWVMDNIITKCGASLLEYPSHEDLERRTYYRKT